MDFRRHRDCNLDPRCTKGLHLGGSRRIHTFAEIYNASSRKNNAVYPKNHRDD